MNENLIPPQVRTHSWLMTILNFEKSHICLHYQLWEVIIFYIKIPDSPLWQYLLLILHFTFNIFAYAVLHVKIMLISTYSHKLLFLMILSPIMTKLRKTQTRLDCSFISFKHTTRQNLKLTIWISFLPLNNSTIWRSLCLLYRCKFS